ncbi:single-stranded DNA-binding protein [Paralcaligenes ureilyticus]|uniref:Single-stranded DNA-binding protein n=1 Tax=Paralcaligenes ureilyticus TaxID=627131 RepID=A0A4R3MC50_9BURK|nr:single-stranded DNA-binding protein [Paralcaligenes ureilyticus]TCT10956.1 single-stranded DNA-binding protein [Paralcaligenes ureilyticus]
MIDALISGRLYGVAKRGTGKTGNTYTTAKVKVASGSGETLLCSVIAFDEKAQAALLALDDGDSVALSGSLTPKVYEDKNGATRPSLDLVAHAILTAYHVKHKRQAMTGGGDGN